MIQNYYLQNFKLNYFNFNDFIKLDNGSII